MTITLRKLSILGFLICLSALAGAIFLEEQYLASPCPLCMLQRMVYVLLGITFVFGIIFRLQSILKYFYTGIIFLISLLGFSIAAYQFWLQYFAPPQRISCTASLQRLIETYPFLDALKMAFTNSPECARVDFTIFTISIAGWSVIFFGLFIIVTSYVIYMQKKRWI